MEDLPPPLILDILSRLGSSADVARCRVASKHLNSLSREIRSINLHCSFRRYSRTRFLPLQFQMTPFKSVFKNLLAELPIVDSITIGVEKALRGISYMDLEDDNDDLHLTNEVFVCEWLPLVCDRLQLLSISDFWVQSSWRRSDVLSLISCLCHNLLELEIKNAWLSVDNMNPMPNLSSLTLEYIRLDDAYLDKVNLGFPLLKVLKLIGVGGLKDPKIHLQQLEFFEWSVSNAVFSIEICAPRLVKLKLKCVSPRLLLLDTPSLSDLHLSLEGAGHFNVQELSNLTKLHLEYVNLHKLLQNFPFGLTIKNLKLSLIKSPEQGMPNLCFESLFSVFPSVTSLTLTPWIWSALEMQICRSDLNFRTWLMGLKTITAYLEMHDFETTVSLIFSLVESCSRLSHMKISIHRDVDSNSASTLIFRCVHHFSRVRWKFGVWKEETEDVWLPCGVYDLSNLIV